MRERVSIGLIDTCAVHWATSNMTSLVCYSQGQVHQALWVAGRAWEETICLVAGRDKARAWGMKGAGIDHSG